MLSDAVELAKQWVRLPLDGRRRFGVPILLASALISVSGCATAPMTPGAQVERASEWRPDSLGACPLKTAAFRDSVSWAIVGAGSYSTTAQALLGPARGQERNGRMVVGSPANATQGRNCSLE